MFSPRIELAITTTLEAHGLARRKAERGYEAAHVLAVALIARDFGFGEDVLVGAILHDTLEDTSLDPQVIASRFGEQMLEIVRDLTEPPKTTPWRERKETYIERLRHSAHDEARAIASADKIHNLASMTTGFKTQGLAFAKLFSADVDGLVWYHQRVLQMLADTWTDPIAAPILTEHRRRLDLFLATARAVWS